MSRPSTKEILSSFLERFTEKSPEVARMGLKAKLARLFLAAIATTDDSLKVDLRKVAENAGIVTQVQGYINKLVANRWVDQLNENSWAISRSAVKKLAATLRGADPQDGSRDKPRRGRKTKKTRKQKARRGKHQSTTKQSAARGNAKFLRMLEKLPVSGLIKLGESVKAEIADGQERLAAIKDYAKKALVSLQ